jgi:hypothetical protein
MRVRGSLLHAFTRAFSLTSGCLAYPCPSVANDRHTSIGVHPRQSAAKWSVIASRQRGQVRATGVWTISAPAEAAF